ncbi:hypothetical protein VP01_302g2 [Puccinia sorghi]|uniref:Uncharacterized protein n=1 Tax=Puccinia sorghi TaxID=27349 RepID=A0A0L6V061_9BASI|nr:hypothetical protein VP01_302g2 [Puccinia sorghi]
MYITITRRRGVSVVGDQPRNTCCNSPPGSLTFMCPLFSNFHHSNLIHESLHPPSPPPVTCSISVQHLNVIKKSCLCAGAKKSIQMMYNTVAVKSIRICSDLGITGGQCFDLVTPSGSCQGFSQLGDYLQPWHLCPQLAICYLNHNNVISSFSHHLELDKFSCTSICNQQPLEGCTALLLGNLTWWRAYMELFFVCVCVLCVMTHFSTGRRVLPESPSKGSGGCAPPLVFVKEKCAPGCAGAPRRAVESGADTQINILDQIMYIGMIPITQMERCRPLFAWLQGYMINKLYVNILKKEDLHNQTPCCSKGASHLKTLTTLLRTE